MIRKPTLPVDAILPKVLAILQHTTNLVIEASPGTGKTSVESAELFLDRLGANDGMEQQLARFPLSPRLCRILVEALDRGVGEDGCLATALLGLGVRSEKNDFLAAMDLPQEYRLRQHWALALNAPFLEPSWNMDHEIVDETPY